MIPNELNFFIDYWTEHSNPDVRRNLSNPPPIDLFDFGRRDMARLFSMVGYKVGVEIGVERGVFSEILCLENPGVELHCVDPWAVYESGVVEHRTKSKVEEFYEIAVNRLKKYNCKIHRMPSSRAARKIFKPDQLDFVYIDGDHDYEPVINDLTDYYPLVRRGGVIAGHDYFNNPANRHLMVGPALRLWAKAYGIDPWFTFGRSRTTNSFKADSARSFMFVKE